MSEKPEIPLDVTNPKEYLKYWALSRHSLLRAPIYTASTGEEISVAMLPHRLSAKIAHLSPAEQDTVMEMKRQFNTILAAKSTAKRLAYSKPNADGTTTARQRYTALESDVVELLGRMFNCKEVVEILGRDYGVHVREDDVQEVLRKYIVEIERKRNEFRDKISDVRLYHKRSRLEELAWMYSSVKTRYIALRSDQAYTAMLRTLEQIRKESEGDILNVSGALDVNIEVELQAHIQKEIFKTINLREIILGRVSARMGFDTAKLVAGLHNSYYAKFTYISGDYDPDAEVSYPSLMQYDFDRIAREIDVDAVEDIKAIDVTESESNTARSAKDIFLAKIREQRKPIEERIKGYDAEEELARKAHNPNTTVARGPGRNKDHIIPGGSKASKAAGGTGKRTPTERAIKDKARRDNKPKE